MKVKATSLLSISPFGEDYDGVAYFGARPRIEIEVHISDKYHTFTHNDRLETISYKYYDSVDYWWALADINNIADPLNISIGTQIRIPVLSRIQQAIKEAQQ
ncbi:MAG: LysM peptidoglycan-binding domain-containing protein [Prolixibacteraceae bacterium]|nr:LysM peptidoglycan-binding domain-containing protein [Prolixibacteraceae bacterium]